MKKNLAAKDLKIICIYGKFSFEIQRIWPLYCVCFLWCFFSEMEKWWQLIWFCSTFCTVVLMQITRMYFYCVSLYALFKINQSYLFNNSSEKSFCILSHSNHLSLDSLHYSEVFFQRWNIQNDIPHEGKSLLCIVTS